MACSSSTAARNVRSYEPLHLAGDEVERWETVLQMPYRKGQLREWKRNLLQGSAVAGECTITNTAVCDPADVKEFVKISQAVGVGFIVMGAVGYFVKLGTLASSSSLLLRPPQRH